MTHLLADLGWVDLDLGCFTVLIGQHRSCSTAQRPVEHPKSKSTQPRSGRRWVTLYVFQYQISPLFQGVRASVVDRVQGADLVARVRQERGHHLEVPDHDQGRGAARPHREGPLHGHVARRIRRGESLIHPLTPDFGAPKSISWLLYSWFTDRHMSAKISWTTIWKSTPVLQNPGTAYPLSWGSENPKVVQRYASDCQA